MSLLDTKPFTPQLLNTIDIRNFRAFRYLQIPHLGRVNLITGKNNVGKSSFLEALWLYAKRGSLSTLRSLLTTRDEYRPQRSRRMAFEDSYVADTTEDFTEPLKIRALFNGRPKISQDLPFIAITNGSSDGGLVVTLQTRLSSENIEPENLRLLDVIPDEREHSLRSIYILILWAGKPLQIYTLDDLESPSQSTSREGELSRISSQFVRSSGMGEIATGNLWDKVALTSSEDDVLTALRVISSDVERVTLIGERSSIRGRIPFVRIKGMNEPVPMRSLGDGMNRLFGLSLSLANARDGMLLIDEIENGLHYSVLLNVWRILFASARRLNVQVFATTHSWDCIQAFQQAADEDEQDEGALIRLQNSNSDVTATVFDERRLAVVTREQIEVR